MSSEAYSPEHYDKHTADDIEKVIDGLPAKEAAQLYNVLKYFERRNHKGQKESDLEKANNSAHRLVFGEWRSNADRVRAVQGEEIQQCSEITRKGKTKKISKKDLREMR